MNTFDRTTSTTIWVLPTANSRWISAIVVGLLFATLGSASAVACVTPTHPALICPQGDGPTLADVGLVNVIARDANCDPIANYPWEDMALDGMNPGDINWCETPPVADIDSDANGETTMVGILAGGGYSPSAVISFAGNPGPPLGVALVSVDISGDCVVNLVDVAILAACLSTGDPRCDYDGNGVVALPDVGDFAPHIGHSN